MGQILKIAITGLLSGTIALVVAFAAGWGAYATSPIGQVFSYIFGWPFMLVRGIPQTPGSDFSFLLAIGIHYAFYIALAWGFWHLRTNRRRDAA